MEWFMRAAITGLMGFLSILGQDHATELSLSTRDDKLQELLQNQRRALLGELFTAAIMTVAPRIHWK